MTYQIKISFTFHYVSIKTASPSETTSPDGTFTFHYVSIKTAFLRRIHKVINLYIPLCLY